MHRIWNKWNAFRL